MIKFRPTGELSMPSDTYEQELSEYFKTIPEGSVLFEIYAMDAPEADGGQELLIGELITDSILTPSLFGDDHLAFKHQKMEEDFELKPEWEKFLEVPRFYESELELAGEIIYGCPLSSLWRHFR